MSDAYSLHLQSKLRIGAIVLAAGAGARIGHRPKCLLERQDEALLMRLLRALSANAIGEIVVVLGHYAEQIEPLLTSTSVTSVRNSNPDAGQNSSLHCGLSALGDDLDAVLVALADQPLLDAQDIAALLQAFATRPAHSEVLVPMQGTLPGNPVIFSNTVRKAILRRDVAFGCKQWQQQNPERVYRWQTDNDHYCVDIDSLADIEALAQQRGIQLRWPSTS